MNLKDPIHKNKLHEISTVTTIININQHDVKLTTEHPLTQEETLEIGIWTKKLEDRLRKEAA